MDGESVRELTDVRRCGKSMSRQDRDRGVEMRSTERNLGS